MGRKQEKPLLAKIAPDHPFFDIIEEAYRVFVYPKPAITGVCEGCCMYADIEADFYNPPIADLPLHYLSDWYSAAYDLGGVPKGVWGYLLPRVLEVLAVGEEITLVGMEVSLNRFATGNAENWSAEEWQVLDRFQRAYLARELKQEGHAEFLDDTLCMFALAAWPMPNLLEQVAAFPDEILAEKLWRDWCGWGLPGTDSIWITAFWEGELKTEVFGFYTSRELYDRMEALVLGDGTPEELAKKASTVANVIEMNADWAAGS